MAGAGSHGQNGAARGAEAAPAPRQWELAPELPLAQLDAAAPDLTRLQVQLLANRGLRGEPARQFMDAAWRAQPPQLLGMDAAVERIRRAAERGEQVVVFGDFDVDGLTSCAVMLLALLAIGIAARAYVPARDAAGRGPSEEAVRALAAEGTQLLVTTDCGTTNVAEVELAARLGIDVIVTDHHLPQGPLAPAVALVNPRQPGCPSSAANLAGVGVAFRVAEVLLAAGGSVDRIATLEALLDLVAIGTVGDMAPMTPENWALVRAGLHRLNTRPRAGLLLLLDKAGVQMGTATERDISFAVAPRLNAAGRMGDPLVALHLLTTEDHDEATRLARELEQLNAARQQATDAVVVAARAQVLAQLQVSQPVLFAAGDGWPLGIIGLVANRLTEEFDRPVIVVSRGETECRGSMRGPVGLNLVEALGQRAELLRHFGGHAQAAGFTTAPGDLDTLVIHLRAAARQARGRTAGTPAIDAPRATDAGELPA
ncbi:MAG TPA: DHH family phosphoesterase, partial [Ktedonobacterales bacterium]|nr:DHH family phosphoesterase [Ktedonobacterales bacterium]